MRCKNCGSENDDNLYICQNCGSPLYDEEETESTVYDDDEMGKTRVAPVVSTGNRYTDSGKQQSVRHETEEEKKKKQQTTVLIIVLVMVLVAIIASVAIVVASSNKNKNIDPSENIAVSHSTTDESSTQSTTEKTTTTTTTEKTTTTTTTTTAKIYHVSVSFNSDGGGEVEGEGDYESGEKCTVVARADDNYEFDGWYINGKKVSSKSAYSFTVKSDTNLQAVFTALNTDDEEY